MPVMFTCVPTTSHRRLPKYLSPAELSAARNTLERSFGGVVIDGPAGLLTNMDVAAETANATSALRIALTHWSGVMHPLVAADQIARLDRLSGGRLSLRFLSAPDGHEAALADHTETLRQTDEYLVLLKRLWSNEEPFDHEGPHYSVAAGVIDNRGPQGVDIAIRMGGASGVALDVAGRHATVFELSGGSPDEIRALMERVTAAASNYGRTGKISFALPVTLSETTPAADHSHLGAVHLHGPVARIAQDLLSYAALGIEEFMVGGLDGPEQVERFARDIVPVFRRTVPLRLARGHARFGMFPGNQRPMG